jgi:transposase
MTTTTNAARNCYVAIELSQKSWLIGILRPDDTKVSTRTVGPGDTAALLAELEKAVARGQTTVTEPPDYGSLRVCFEAGFDGFWLARFLLDRGIPTLVLDPSSFLVSRRGRRAKTDRLDVEAMVFTLKAFSLGDKSVCRPVRLPTPAEEDAKRMSRERGQLKKERTRHVNRIRSLLTLHGVRAVPGLWGGKWRDWLEQLQTGDGRRLGPFLRREIAREFERLELVTRQLKDLEAERTTACSADDDVPCAAKIAVLQKVAGIGEVGATLLVTEVFHRRFQNRRHLASYLGLSPSPYASGAVSRDQGISKAGNKQARVMLVELAWCWLKYQPSSRLSQWYRARFGGSSSRAGKVGVVALARKLAIALWRFVEDGVVPEGARLKCAS